MSPVAVARRRLQVLPWVTLTMVWVLLWGNVSVGNVVAGVLVGAFVLLVFPLPPVTFGVRVRLWPLLVLIATFVGDVVKASMEVAYKAVVPWEHPVARTIRVPLRSRHDLFTTLTAEMSSLVPGSMVVDIDRDDHSLLLHVFDAPTQRDLERIYDETRRQERRVLRAFAARAESILTGTCDGSEDVPEPENDQDGRDGRDDRDRDHPLHEDAREGSRP